MIRLYYDITGPIFGTIGLLIIAFLVFAVFAGIAQAELSVPDVGSLVNQAAGRLADVDSSTGHAEEKHGVNLSTQVRNCIDGGKHVQTWRSSSNDRRWIEVCRLGNGWDWWGLRVSDNDPDKGFVEVTIFDIEGEIQQVEEYLIRNEYYDVTPVLR